MKPIRRLFLASVTVVLVFLLTTFNVFSIDWGGFQKDETRNGFIAENIKLPLQLAKEINVGEELVGGILINNNDYFFTTKNGKVGSGSSYAEGDINWQRKLNEKIQGCAVLSAYDIFVVTMNGNLFSLSQKTGAILWKSSLGKEVIVPLLIAYQFVYAADVSGSLYCVSMLNGNILWKSDLNEAITGICFKNNNIYAVTEIGQIACFDSQNGKKYWNSTVGKSTKNPPISGTEAIYFGDDEGNLYCYDSYTGKQYFAKNLNSKIVSPMAFAYIDKRVLVVGLLDRYVGLTTGNGNIMWSYMTDYTSLAPVSAGRQIYLQGANQSFVVLDSFDGKELYNYPLKTRISTGMAISNGKIFFGTKAGTIMMFSSMMNDFQLEITPAIQTISPGGSAKYEINVIANKDFVGPIYFAVSGFPCSCKGVNRSFDEQSINEPKKVILTIDASLEVVEDRYDFTILAYSGRDLVRTTHGTIEITGKRKPTYLRIEKTIETIKSGQEFFLDINIYEARDIKSISFILNYPKDVLYVQDVVVGDFFKESAIQVFDKTIYNDSGKLVIGYSSKDATKSGTGKIARIIAKALKPGLHLIKFNQYSLRDTFHRETLALLNDTEVSILPGHQKKIVLTINKKTMLIDGKASQLDSPPVIEKGRTLIPIRMIAENLESTVLWDNKEQKVTIIHFNKRIELWINKVTCFVDGEEKVIPSNVPPRILFNRTYVPLKFVADELDASIFWDSKTQTITILYPK